MTFTYDPDDRFHSAVAGFEEARDAGRTPDPNEWLARFPDVAARLAVYFATQRRLTCLATPPAVASLTLAVIEGRSKGLMFTFDGPGTFLVGRSGRAQFQLPSGSGADLRISHTHFLVEVNLPRCRVHDLNSHNGTFVNGQR